MTNKKSKPSPTKDVTPAEHPIPSAIDSYLHWVRDSQHATAKSITLLVKDVQGGFKTVKSDIRKANREINWFPKVSVSDGIARLFEWIKENKGLFEHL